MTPSWWHWNYLRFVHTNDIMRVYKLKYYSQHDITKFEEVDSYCSWKKSDITNYHVIGKYRFEPNGNGSVKINEGLTYPGVRFLFEIVTNYNLAPKDQSHTSQHCIKLKRFKRLWRLFQKTVLPTNRTRPPLLIQCFGYFRAILWSSYNSSIETVFQIIDECFSSYMWKLALYLNDKTAVNDI